MAGEPQRFHSRGQHQSEFVAELSKAPETPTIVGGEHRHDGREPVFSPEKVNQLANPSHELVDPLCWRGKACASRRPTDPADRFRASAFRVTSAGERLRTAVNSYLEPIRKTMRTLRFANRCCLAEM